MNRAVMSLDDVFDNGKSKTCTAQITAAGFVDAVETFEDTGLVFFGDPAS
jgi:hypothetical protein